jgi:predicted nuclease with TOPRIM domain
LKAIAFITKRGETGFTTYNLIAPYYRARADWQFVEGLVNVALGEKVKYEPGMRWAIITVSKGAKSLTEVRSRAVELKEKAKRQFVRQTLEKLIAYLDIIIPELEKYEFSDRLELTDGVNVMDLSGMRLETQQLVIASTIEYAFQHLSGVVVVIPEAWEMLPQHRMTPVKWVAEQFIRKGAAIGNYLWLDSQDIGGIDKTPLRQCDNWLMGRMKEAHEVERILKQLLGLKIGKEEIQRLPLGHFYAAIGDSVHKVYVLPAGVPEEVGRKVALGELSPEYVRDHFLKSRLMEDEEMWRRRFEELKAEFDRRVEEERQKAYREAMEKFERVKKEWKIKEYQETIVKLRDKVQQLEAENKQKSDQIKQLEKQLKHFQALKQAFQDVFGKPAVTTTIPKGADVPSSMVVVKQQPAITVKLQRKQLELTDKTLEGKIAIVYAEGKLPNDKWFTTTDVTNAFISHGWPKDPRTGPTLDKFCQWDFFEKHYAGKRPEYRIKITPEQARQKGLLKEVEA